MTERHFADSEPLGTFDWSDAEGPSHSLVMELSEVLDVRPTGFDPLQTVVDTDALDAIFSPSENGAAPADGRVDFGYLDYRVVVEADGQGYFYEQEEQ